MHKFEDTCFQHRLDADSSNSDGSVGQESDYPTWERVSPSKRQAELLLAVLCAIGRPFNANPGAPASAQARTLETYAFPIADLIGVVRVVRCDAGGCATNAHSAAQEEQIHAGAGAESRWRCGAQET